MYGNQSIALVLANFMNPKRANASVDWHGAGGPKTKCFACLTVVART